MMSTRGAWRKARSNERDDSRIWLARFKLMPNQQDPSGRGPESIVDSPDLAWDDVATKADGPQGSLPLTDEMLRNWPSGDLFG